MATVFLENHPFWISKGNLKVTKRNLLKDGKAQVELARSTDPAQHTLMKPLPASFG